MRKLTLFLLIGLCFGRANANHLIGGRFQYKYIGNNTFKFEAFIERECFSSGAGFDQNLVVGLFNQKTGAKVLNLTFTRDSISNSNKYYACNLLNTCIQVGNYSCILKINSGLRALLSDSNNYYLNWERCCDLQSIRNIMFPGNSPYSALLDFPPLVLPNDTTKVYINNSPTSTLIFNPLICSGKEFSYNFNFTDPDGDSLSYKLIKPLAGGYTSVTSPLQSNGPKPYEEITWADSYSLNNVIDADNGLKIDSVSGQITVKPNDIGIYLFSFIVEEYRNKIKIGTVYYQSILRVQVCNNFYISLQPSDNYTTTNSDVTFSVDHTDPNAIYLWQYSAPNSAPSYLANANNKSLILTNIDTSLDGYRYRCEIRSTLCTEYTRYATLHVRTTGLNNRNKEEIKLIPNPSNSYIEFKDRYPRNIKVYNTAGSLVLEKLNCVELDISELADGVYTIQYYDSRNNNSGFLKLIKTP